MSTSIVHVLAIVGKAADQVEAACDEILGRRVPRKSKAYGTDDWSQKDHQDLELLCKPLISVARKLPVLYYAQYLDSWSVASAPFRLLDWSDQKKRIIYGSEHHLVYYPSKFAKEIGSQIEKWRGTEVYRNQSEDRWFLDHVYEALGSALWLDREFVVVCIDEIFDASRHHEEIKAALDKSIDLSAK